MSQVGEFHFWLNRLFWDQFCLSHFQSPWFLHPLPTPTQPLPRPNHRPYPLHTMHQNIFQHFIALFTPILSTITIITLWAHYEPHCCCHLLCPSSAAPTSTTPNYHCSYLYLYGYAHVEHIPTLSIAFCTHSSLLSYSCLVPIHLLALYTHTCKTPETLLHTLVQLQH